MSVILICNHATQTIQQSVPPWKQGLFPHSLGLVQPLSGTLFPELTNLCKASAL